MKTDLFNISYLPSLEEPSLFVGWLSQDAGKVSSRVLFSLLESVEAEEVAELNLPDFFSFDGALFRDDIVSVPESKFWASEKHNMLFFLSDEPEQESFRFHNGLLDFAQKNFRAKHIFTVNGAASYMAHSSSRQVMTVFNQENLKEGFAGYEELTPMDWEGPPAASSYLLWVAQRRSLAGVSFWAEVPFYLAALEDPRAVKTILSLFNRAFNLEINLVELDKKSEQQHEKLEQFFNANPELKEITEKLESELSLSEEEQVRLSTEVYKFLSQ